LAKNRQLRLRTAQDIDQRIARVLEGLGNPEPPLNLVIVRELLKLDRVFYTADDPNLMQEVVSRIRVATIQVFKRPTLLLDAIKKLSLQALYIPDQKRILLDQNLPTKKHRWNEAHEIGHSLLPWHEDMMLGDTALTISQDCHEQIEAEANYAAGRLLFLRERFVVEAKDCSPNILSIQNLRNTFGNTLSTTFYRFIEAAGDERPMVGLMTEHPHPSRRSDDFDILNPCRHFIRSPAFASRFDRITEFDLFTSVEGYCADKRGGPLGATELMLTDDNGSEHRFYFETFYNQYDALTLGVYIDEKPLSISLA